MKLLLIYLEKEKNSAAQLGALLEEMNIRSEALLLNPEDGDITQFSCFFGAQSSDGKDKNKGDPTHVVVLSPLPPQWFNFLAGFSYGSHLPLLVYGQEAIPGISREFASCFTFLKTRDSLKMFLEVEYGAFKKQKAARNTLEAQETLLGMGVPITGESLAQCVSEGRVREVSLFLDAGFSPNTRNKTGVPLLNIAARSGNREIVGFLVTADADVNLQADDRGTSALMDSVMGKHHELVKALVEAGADVNIRSKSEQNALIVAVGSGDTETVEILLKAGADPDIRDSLGASARKYAALFHKSDIVSLFDAYAPAKA